MKNQANITGDGNSVDQSERNHVKIQGDGNNVRYKPKEIYIDQRKTEIRQVAAGKKGGQGELAMSSAAISLFAGWFYVRNFDAFIDYLQKGVLLSAAPAMLTLLLVITRAASNDGETAPVRMQDLIRMFLGPIIAVGLLWLTNITASALPGEIIEAAQALKVKDFWHYLNQAQQITLVENIVAIVSIAFSACTNLAMTVHGCADEMLERTDRNFALRLFGLTYKSRPQRALCFQFIFITCVYLALSGKGLDLVHQWQDFVSSSLS
jgi:hypothetical protein